MKKVYFVTGTDTGVGKTTISCQLLQAFNRQGLTTAAIKPLASGCITTDDGLRSEDALALQQSCSLSLDYDLINPYAFAPPHCTPYCSGKK